MSERGRDDGPAGDDVARKAENIGDRAIEKAEALGERAAETVQQVADEQKSRSAERVDHVAEALRTSAEQLEPTEQQLANLVGSAASQLETFARTLREKDLSALVAEVEAFGRREPAMFMGAAVALGFGISRFAKASARSAGGGERRDLREVRPAGAASGEDVRGPLGGASTHAGGPPPVSPSVPGGHHQTRT
jgi:hypothetical protein